MTKIIYEFCDSDFIDQNNYVDTIIRLQEIFYLFKNEMQDEITDDELLHLMKEQFELIWIIWKEPALPILRRPSGRAMADIRERTAWENTLSLMK